MFYASYLICLITPSLFSQLSSDLDLILVYIHEYQPMCDFRDGGKQCILFGHDSALRYRDK